MYPYALDNDKLGVNPSWHKFSMVGIFVPLVNRKATSAVTQWSCLQIVHRDLKPANVLLSGYTPGVGGGGVVKLCDFGFARRVGGRLRGQATAGGGGWNGKDAAASVALEYGAYRDDAAPMSSYVMTRWYRPPGT